MSDGERVSAIFGTVREATAAVDWFRNQGTDPAAIGIEVRSAGQAPRPTRSGDNLRTDLSLIVSLDVDKAPFGRRLAIETFVREGGKVTSRR